MKTITASELKRRLRSTEEIALLDMREEVDFYRSHLLFAVNIPLSRLEQMIGDLVPRHGAPIVTCDAGEGLAAHGAERLAWLGYNNVMVLEGGNPGWEKAGGILFAGANVPSKAFGEFVEHEYGTPHITAEELHGKLAGKDDLVILDSRPFEEFQIMSIPGGQDCPGAELVYRAREAAPNPNTTIVVNCAGRTRSIIGTQSLINSGIPNKVMALKDGTMGWELAGLEVARKSIQRAPSATAAGISTALAGAKAVADRAGVRLIDAATLDGFRAEREQRTLYVLDVRQPEEYEAGHLEDALPAFGGQLVQSTDRFVAVRGARLVLVDDTEVRALMTASWLRQMGWDDVFVLAGGIGALPKVAGRRRSAMLGLDRIAPTLVDPAQAQRLLSQGQAAVIDLADPRRFKAEHIAGAWYAVRSKLPQGLDRFDAGQTLLFTSSDGRFAALAAAEIAERTGRKTAAIEGGTAAWKRSSLPLESGESTLLHPREETWSPYDEAHRTRQSMLDYLSWEVDLYDRIKKDGDTRFRMLAGT
ncbi:rhodanese-like domain-containing protein [Ferrovibrio sp.]|uniref:rhodanese-like domain-containing protein n=1 Tax=Ferrovibrio sp. TaxID=1917215 RepID=UPI003D1024FB